MEEQQKKLVDDIFDPWNAGSYETHQAIEQLETIVQTTNDPGVRNYAQASLDTVIAHT
jgi:hypothetical protein